MSTALPRGVRQAVYERDEWACIRCFIASALQVHHRHPRKSGGTSRPDIHDPANLITLCSRCHAHVESRRTQSYRLGLLVPTGEDPAAWPVYRGRGLWQQPGTAWTPAQPQPDQSAEVAPW